MVRRLALALLDRYIFRELAAPFAIGLGLTTLFLVIDRLYQLTELVITKGVPFHLVLQLLVVMLPSFLAHTLPIALLLAVLLAGGRLAADLEIVALKAAGVSLLRLARPVLLAAGLVAAATAALTLALAPAATRQFQYQLFRILQSRAVSGLTERVFTTSFADLVIYVEEISPSQVALRGLVISDEHDPRLTRIITAREGRLFTDEARQRVTLRLLDGALHEADVAPATPPGPGGTVPRPGGAASARRYRYTTFELYDMALRLESPLESAGRFEKPEKDAGLGELRRRIADLRSDPQARRPWEVELHKRFAFPVAALVFALVGFPLAVRAHRSGRSAALVATLAIVVAYYLLLTSLEDMALKGQLPTALAIWAPNVLFTLVGAVLLGVTAREWRAPRMSVLWRALDGLWQRLPRRRARPTERFTGAGPDTTLLIDRYLLRQYLGFLLIGLAVGVVLLTLVDLLQRLDRYLRVKPPIRYIVEHLLYTLPGMLYDGLPVIMLVATIFLFLSLTRWHELTALKAAGISLYRVCTPILGLAVTVAVGAGLFQEFALPGLSDRAEEVYRVKIRGQPPRHLRTRARLWLRSSDTRFYRVELVNPATSDLHGVTVLELDRDFRVVSRLDARRAHWTARGWELSDGAFREIGSDRRLITIPFQRTAVDLGETLQDFLEVQKPPWAMSYRELREYVARLEAAGFQTRKYLVDMYVKLSTPLRNLVMVLVAIPFAVAWARGGRTYGIALAVAIVAAYLVVDYSARALGRADLLPPLLAAWTANAVFLGIGASLLLRART